MKNIFEINKHSNLFNIQIKEKYLVIKFCCDWYKMIQCDDDDAIKVCYLWSMNRKYRHSIPNMLSASKNSKNYLLSYRNNQKWRLMVAFNLFEKIKLKTKWKRKKKHTQISFIKFWNAFWVGFYKWNLQKILIQYEKLGEVYFSFACETSMNGLV